jgi:lipopolysaccharide/colanic/teichoic acid biosynthesis glycosyltransferase
MSLVGPRPCLPTQHDVIAARLARNCFRSLPGITGAAQIEKIDMSEPERLAAADAAMVEAMCLQKYGYYVWRTACGAGAGDAAERYSNAGRYRRRQTARWLSR